MSISLQDMARNALGCLDISEQTGRGQELEIIYDGLTTFKPALARQIALTASQMGARVGVVNMDEFLNRYESNDDAIAAIQQQLHYDANNPLKRNAVNMVAPVGRHDSIRRVITKGLLGQQAYILQFPFVHQQTAEAILSTDPKEAEEIGLRMKADLDRATDYHLVSGASLDSRMSWQINPKLRWVISVGMIKKYSVRGENGEPIGGWGNPGCETFTSFAVDENDHGRINGEFYVDAFASGRVLQPTESFLVHVVNGAVDVDRFREENGHVGDELMRSLVGSFTKDKYASHLGELGIGLMPRIGLADAVETLPLEKIGGTLHIAPGYDESDRGTGGGFAGSKAHNDLGIRVPYFAAKVNGRWATVLQNGSSPYFSQVA